MQMHLMAEYIFAQRLISQVEFHDYFRISLSWLRPPRSIGWNGASRPRLDNSPRLRGAIRPQCIVKIWLAHRLLINDRRSA